MHKKLLLAALLTVSSSVALATGSSNVEAESGASASSEVLPAGDSGAASSVEATGGTSTAAGAGYGSAAGDNDMLFVQLDANKDGMVTEEEAGKSASIKAEFDRIDKDTDGKLSAAEMSAWNGAKDTGTGVTGSDAGSNSGVTEGTTEAVEPAPNNPAPNNVDK